MSEWRVAAKSKCGPSNVLQMCFICINCPHSCSSFRVYLHTLSVLTLQFRLSYLKLCLYAHECQWRGIFWMLAVIFFFYPAPTQTHQLCFLKTGSQRKLWCTRTEWMLLPPTFKSASASFLCEIFATLYTQEYVGMFVLEATTHSTTLD